MSAQEILAELPNLRAEEREIILRKIVRLSEEFVPSPAMEEAIAEGLRALKETKTYSGAEVRSRVAAWTAR